MRSVYKLKIVAQKPQKLLKRYLTKRKFISSDTEGQYRFV